MTRRRKHIDIKYIIAGVVALVLVVIAILSYAIKNNSKLNIVESVFKDTVVGIQRVVYYPFNGINSIISEYNSLKNVLSENEILKTDIDKMDSLEAENNELKREIESLKEELSIDYVLSDYTYLNATVVSRNVGYWYNTLTVDKGSNNGVKEGMVVVNSQGVIGKVSSVSRFTSDIKLITTTDTNNKISVTVSSGNNKITGLINGYDYNDCVLEVEGISNTESVNVGDLVYTSGLGGVFPSGILIGTVESITTDVYDLSKIINVTPSADFDDINYVSILQRNDKDDN